LSQSTYYSFWDGRTTQQETAKALAAHPDIHGIWAKRQTGAGKAANIPMGLDWRWALKISRKEVCEESPPATSSFTFKLMMEALTGKRKLTMLTNLNCTDYDHQPQKTKFPA
jgi:ribose transport system substrate-binding protein